MVSLVDWKRENVHGKDLSMDFLLPPILHRASTWMKALDASFLYSSLDLLISSEAIRCGHYCSRPRPKPNSFWVKLDPFWIK